MIRCAITELSAHEGGASDPQRHLLGQVDRWIADPIEFIQLREKTLGGAALLALAEQLVNRAAHSSTRILINSRADVAVASRADGVHLPADAGSLTPLEIREIFAAGGRKPPLVSVSCHSVGEVERAVSQRADLLLFGPVFEKRVGSVAVRQGTGLPLLRKAVLAAKGVPVLALGGVTQETSASCLEAGAAGIAAIRLFA